MVLLSYHQQFFPSFYGLTQILKLTITAFLSLTLRVKTSILSVRFFTKMERLNHGIILNQNTTLKTTLKYRWIQLTDALPKLWKERILNCIGNSMNLCIFDHHLIKKTTTYTA